MNSGAIGNYPPGMDINHPHLSEAPEPVSECGDCHAVCYERNLTECGCGCQVIACSKCTTEVDGRQWRATCAREHREEMDLQDRLEKAELAGCWADLAHDLREARKLGDRFQRSDAPSGEITDALRLLTESADLLAKRAADLKKAARDRWRWERR